MDGKNQGREIYDRLTKKKAAILVILLSGILLSLVVNIFVGSAGLTFIETMRSILGISDAQQQVIVWQFRMPVALAAIFIGMALGIGGCEMQTVLRNPMASPYTLGISSAASFGAALAIILKFSIVPGLGNVIVSLNAFLFAMFASLTIFLFSKKFNSDRRVLILFGIALNFLFGSLTTLLQYIADERDLQTLIFWSFGNLTKIGWEKLAIIVAGTTMAFVVFFSKSWNLTAMSLGDASAKSLGINAGKVRRYSITLISFLSAIAISFAGTIGFIGLVAPHIARLMCGEDQRYFLPVSALVGALVLSVASIFSKTIVPGTILPIGLVTSLIGIPFFTYLILKKKGCYL